MGLSDWSEALQRFAEIGLPLKLFHQDRADHAAAVLRLYAKKYHAPPKPVARPTSALVADLMAKVEATPLVEGAIRSPEYA